MKWENRNVIHLRKILEIFCTCIMIMSHLSRLITVTYITNGCFSLTGMEGGLNSFGVLINCEDTNISTVI